jgi:serine/threonine protein kinase
VINIFRGDKKYLELKVLTGWLLEMCQALKYIHGLSVLHRDLKPLNIFITSGGQHHS